MSRWPKLPRKDDAHKWMVIDPNINPPREQSLTPRRLLDPVIPLRNAVSRPAEDVIHRRNTFM